MLSRPLPSRCHARSARESDLALQKSPLGVGYHVADLLGLDLLSDTPNLAGRVLRLLPENLAD